MALNTDSFPFPSHHPQYYYKLRNSDKEIFFQQSEGGIKCPICGKVAKNIKIHFTKNQICSAKIDFFHFVTMYENITAKFRKEYLKIKKQTERQKAREKDEEGHQRAMAEEKQTQRQKARENDEEGHRRAMAEEKQTQRQKAREKDETGYLRTKADEIQAHRLKEKEQTDDRQRIFNFKKSVMFGPIFICSCCHRTLFENGVSKITDDFKRKIDEKHKILYSKVIPPKQEQYIKIVVNGNLQPYSGLYICHTCKNTLMAGRMPAMAVQNGLQLVDVPDDVKLTELENNLIAQNINFQYIFQLHKSRWAATKNQMISVPVSPEQVKETVSQLPRLPKDAGLIEIKLKRKKEYKNSYKNELINPDRVIRALQHLQISGHPYYQYCDDYNVDSYKERCKQEDKKGHDLLFKEAESSAKYRKDMPQNLENTFADLELGEAEIETETLDKDEENADNRKIDDLVEYIEGLFDDDDLVVEIFTFDPHQIDGLGEVEVVEINTFSHDFPNMRLMIGDFGADHVEGVEDEKKREEIINDALYLMSENKRLTEKCKSKNLIIVLQKDLTR